MAAISGCYARRVLGGVCFLRCGVEWTEHIHNIHNEEHTMHSITIAVIIRATLQIYRYAHHNKKEGTEVMSAGFIRGLRVCAVG